LVLVVLSKLFNFLSLIFIFFWLRQWWW